MYTRDDAYMMEREAVYEMLTKEDEYAAGWGDEKYKKSVHPEFPDHAVSHVTGQPFSEIEWINFAQKYIDEALEAERNYCPDKRAIRIRVLKAASLLVTALQVHGQYTDLDEIAGISSGKYPILRGGLAALKPEVLTDGYTPSAS